MKCSMVSNKPGSHNRAKHMPEAKCHGARVAWRDNTPYYEVSFTGEDGRYYELRLDGDAVWQIVKDTTGLDPKLLRRIEEVRAGV